MSDHLKRMLKESIEINKKFAKMARRKLNRARGQCPRCNSATLILHYNGPRSAKAACTNPACDFVMWS
jgi:hypothetical protein